MGRKERKKKRLFSFFFWLFCRHKEGGKIIGKTWICDTDQTGGYWEVFKCEKCSRVILGGYLGQ